MSNPRSFFSYANKNENFFKNVGLGMERFSNDSNNSIDNPQPAASHFFNSLLIKLPKLPVTIDTFDHNHFMSIGLGHHHR